MKPQLRIHVATLGHLGDRIYAPAIDLKADKLYLLKKPKETNPEPKQALKEVTQNLKKANIDLETYNCDIFDVPSVVTATKNIIQKEKENHLLLNISSGNTLSSNAFTITAMLYKKLAHSIKLYYKAYNYSKMRVGDSEVMNLSAFNISMPSNEQLNILKFISEKSEGAKKKDILKFIHPEYNKLSSNEKSSKLMTLNRRILDKLQFDWKMIRIEGRAKNSTIFLNDTGKEFIAFI